MFGLCWANRMKRIFLIHHLGLGDHIVCNGLVRELIKKCDLIYFPVKHHNFATVKFMFRDIPNHIKYVTVNNDNEMLYWETMNREIFDEPVRLGNFYENNFVNRHKNFCKGFYDNANIDYEKRWESFYVDYGTPKISTDKTNYNFLHQDQSRGYVISDKYKQTEYYEPNHALGQASDTTLFDYYNVMAESNEMHCMDSAFSAWADHIEEFKNKPKYIHRYVKKDKEPDGMWQFYGNNWQILESPETT